jgi:hydroxymethylglutaryl-CoA reductase (NADPH)
MSTRTVAPERAIPERAVPERAAPERAAPQRVARPKRAPRVRGADAAAAAASAAPAGEPRRRIPRDEGDDYSVGIVAERKSFIESFSGALLRHVPRFSFDARVTIGNCEQFTGVAQVPLGFAGPLQVNGEHARGEYLIPLATSEGTLVASYNRGIHALNAAGGVRATVLDDGMQRAPVFVLPDARAGRALASWVAENVSTIREAAESTSQVARLLHIETYLASRFVFLRFSFETGDAAGQNMVTRATAAACHWIVRSFPGVERFYLESNLASDKKTSHVNTLRGRGKRVTAEAVIPASVLEGALRVRSESLLTHYHASSVAAFLAGPSNNGLHAANALAALFIATGQDVASVGESSAGVVHAEPAGDGGLYLSVTLPSLIVATYGGGTGLPTQRECLEVMGCYGKGRVQAFAEIVAGVVLAGELSLAAAIAAHEWVAAHERLGRNR